MCEFELILQTEQKMFLDTNSFHYPALYTGNLFTRNLRYSYIKKRSLVDNTTNKAIVKSFKAS